nr:hypothetical protein [Tanacetum cinerariifolium]
MPAARLTPDDNEARSDWWISSKAYFGDFIGQVERVPFDLSRQNMYEIPFDIYRDFNEQKREIEGNKKEVNNLKEEVRKFRQEMNVQPVRQENKEPIIVEQHYGLSDFSQFQSMQPTNEDDVKTYSISGYTWSFKTWILESFRVTAIRYFDRYNRYPRVAAWSKKKKRFLGHMVIPFFQGGPFSFQRHENSSYFNIGMPPNFQTPMPSQPGSSDWQRQMPAQSATQYWQPDISSQPGSYYSFGQVPSHMGKNEANVPKLFNKNVVQRKTRSLTVAEEIVAYELANSVSIKEPRTQHRRSIQLRIDSQIDEDVADTYAEWGQKLKGPAVDDPAVQSLLDLRKISKPSRLENTSEESANKTNNADKSDTDLTYDKPVRDDDAAGYGVPMYNKTTQTPNSTYPRLTITSSSLDFIQTLLDETPVNELIDLMSHPVYTDAHTTSVVHN